MAYCEPVRRRSRPTPTPVVAGVLVALAALLGVPAVRSLTTSTATATSSTEVVRPDPRPDPQTAPALSAAPIEADRGEHRGPLGETDGAFPDGTTVFDSDVPGVAKLDRPLLVALRRAASDAARERVTFAVDSGWRSAAYQAQLLREAVSKYGSEKEAARWVATPQTSPHVSGDAVDLGHAAATWLARHGATYGLCQIYRNEPWHYELRPAAVAHGCPRQYADPTQDPRMQP